MNVSEEQLSAIDEELAALDDPARVESILSRFAEAERPDLASVDEELEGLAAALEDAESLLAAARANVPSTLVEIAAPEPSETPKAAEVREAEDAGEPGEAGEVEAASGEDDELEMFSEIPPPSEEMEALDAEPEPEAEAATEAEAAPEAKPATEAEPSYTELEAQFFGDSEAPPAPSTPGADPEAAFFGEEGAISGEPPPLNEQDLFADTGDVPAPTAAGSGDLSDLFGSDELAAAAGAEPLADLESAPSAEKIEHDLFDDDEPEATHVFTVDDVAQIERRSSQAPEEPKSEAEAEADAQIDAILAANDAESEGPAATEGAGDSDLDALLADVHAESGLLEGDLTRSEPPAQNPVDAEEVAARSLADDEDEFEMMIDDDDLVMLDDDDLLMEGDSTMVVDSPLGAQAAPEGEAAPAAEAAPAEDPEEGEKKGGFFKKLFGGDE